MPIVHIAAQLSIDELLQAVGQLPPTELDRFVEQVRALQARHLPTTADEMELLRQIQEKFPPNDQARYDILTAKRRAETLTTEEHGELLQLVERAEQLQVQRVAALIELAGRRGTSLELLMD